jgi:hypothetical protein
VTQKNASLLIWLLLIMAAVDVVLFIAWGSIMAVRRFRMENIHMSAPISAWVEVSNG